MKKFFAFATLCALFTAGLTLSGCAEETDVDIEEPAEVEPAPMPAPEPMPAPMPADTMGGMMEEGMEADTVGGTQM